jgi:hypothetical protein
MSSAHKAGKSKKEKKEKKEKRDKKDKKVAKHLQPAAKAHHKEKEPPPKGKGKKPAPAKAASGATGGHGDHREATPPRKASRKAPATQRRGLDGKQYTAGDLLLPNGPQTADELTYFFRGCVAAEHAAMEWAIGEIVSKRNLADADAGIKKELDQQLQNAAHRFATGPIEGMLPARQAPRRTFAGVVERARSRRREIGAFLRGLDLGRTEVSHMDSHGESSLQNLMEWAARIEKLVEEEEPEQIDYNQFHRGLDQLDATTEALIVDVELTLRRLRDRAK